MTIFRKVFDSKKSNSVPDYFERVTTPDDITTDPTAPAPSHPMVSQSPTAQPPVPEGSQSHPLTPQPKTSRPLISEPRVSEPVARPAASYSLTSHAIPSQPVSAQPVIPQPGAAEAGPDKVSGSIFGIGHTEDVQPPASPLHSSVNTTVTGPVTGPVSGPAVDPAAGPIVAHTSDLAAEAAAAVERMQRPAVPPSQQSQPHPAATSVPRMFYPLEAEAPAATQHHHPGNAARTRLLGFHRSQPISTDPLGDITSQKVHAESLFPAGWVAITEGPGEGNALPVFGRVCAIGRGEDQDIRLDFGDTSISRDRHAAIAFDDEQRKFYLGHGGKSNLIRLNGRPVLSTEELHHGDTIRIGETTLRFAALCGEEFTWNGPQNDLA